jgi:hypothetical protein
VHKPFHQAPAGSTTYARLASTAEAIGARSAGHELMVPWDAIDTDHHEPPIE